MHNAFKVFEILFEKCILIEFILAHCLHSIDQEKVENIFGTSLCCDIKLFS